MPLKHRSTKGVIDGMIFTRLVETNVMNSQYHQDPREKNNDDNKGKTPDKQPDPHYVKTKENKNSMEPEELESNEPEELGSDEKNL